MNEKNLRLHSELLYIMDEIHEICILNNIRYTLLAGSLLGAVRHQGFIPWDDDLDIGIYRDDYERFIRIFNEKSKDKFYIMDCDNQYYGNVFVKVMKKNTVALEKELNSKATNMGIFVDVFPLDNKPDSKICMFAQKKINIFLRTLLYAKKGYNLNYDNYLKKISYFTMYFVSFIVPLNFILYFSKKNASLGSTTSKNLINLGGSYSYEKETISTSWLNDIRKYKFSGREYHGIENYHDYLSHLYGDYMSLPKKEDRVFRHNFVELIFSDDYQN